MKPAAFDYAQPVSVPEALSLLADAAGEARVIAGGQSLGPMLNLRLARPRLLVDIARLEALRAIEDIGQAWRIGAAVRHATLEDAAGTLAGAEPLCAVAAGIAYRSVRNRGTIGGSLAHADPAADWPLALAALRAEVTLAGGSGTRQVPADAFMLAAFTTVLGEGEIITAVTVPKLSAGGRFGYRKFCRRTGEFPEAAAAVLLDPERRVARIFLGALSGAPRPLADLARQIAERGGGAATPGALADAVAWAAPELDVEGRRMHTAILARTIGQVLPS